MFQLKFLFQFQSAGSLQNCLFVLHIFVAVKQTDSMQTDFWKKSVKKAYNFGDKCIISSRCWASGRASQFPGYLPQRMRSLAMYSNPLRSE